MSGPEEIIDRGDAVEPELPGIEPAVDPAADPKVAELEAAIEGEGEGDEAKEHKKDTRIPESRHKAILEKEREKRADLERQLAQYQQGGQIANVNAEITAAENSITKMWGEYNTLITDGELDSAAAKQQQITATERQMAEAKSDMKIHAAEIRATERARYNTSLERIESAFPTLNPDHESYDEVLMAEVAELKDAYQMKGHTPTAALQKAVKALVEPQTTRQELATNVKPNVSEKDVAAERKADAVKKTTNAVGKTPPSLNKVGQNSDKAGGGRLDAQQVMNMSQKEFAGLNDETLAQMRGDTI
jgi:hypothetical protein